MQWQREEVSGALTPRAADKFSRREIDGLGEHVKTYRAKGLAWINVTGEGIKSP